MEKNEEKIVSESWIRLVDIDVPPPSLRDNTADADRLKKALKRQFSEENIEISFALTRRLPSLLRRFDFKCSAALFKEGCRWKIIDLFPREDDRHLYAAAVDLGSSTIVIRLVDLITGEKLDDVSFVNPQQDMGIDILSRIHFASEKNGINDLKKILIKKINLEKDKLAAGYNIKPERIVALAAAGNTAMAHFFLGLNPYWICREPYIPVINSPDILRPSDIGIDINEGAPVIVMPNVGSYLGGDVVAGILASGMTGKKDISFLVDVGTNAEVVLGNSEWLLACAGAAGPALEGGVAEMGMMAGSGAIDKVDINQDSKEIHVRTIDDVPPIGICGSGLIDLAAQLFLAGMIDIRGKFNPEKCRERLVDIDGIKNFIIVPASKSGEGKTLYLSQIDVDALLRSKAAMFTILNTISEMANLKMSEIDSFFIAGTFGSYIDPVSAISIGMIPDLPLSKYVSLGNTSLEGVTMALLSSEKRDEIYKIRDMITYIELNVNQQFMNNFSAAKFIPHTDRGLFPSVHEW